MEYKKQHWIPNSYLSAWIDPTSPPNYEGYVWVFSKDGKNSRKKSPKKIFFDNNFYTLRTASGERDLKLEKMLSKIEKDFSETRQNKLLSLEPLTTSEISSMIFFISAMLHRTEAMRDKNKETWNHVLKCMDSMDKSIKFSSRKKIYSSPSTSMPSINHEEVREIAKQPMNLLLPAIEVTAEILAKMNAHFLYLEDSKVGFITSDNPCLYLDPLNPGLYSGLGSHSIELTFPISPKMLAIFFWGDPQHCPYKLAYTPATDEYIEVFNHRTRLFCNKQFIVNQNITKEIWFK